MLQRRAGVPLRTILTHAAAIGTELQRFVGDAVIVRGRQHLLTRCARHAVIRVRRSRRSRRAHPGATQPAHHHTRDAQSGAHQEVCFG
jgi:hypothetical protein